MLVWAAAEFRMLLAIYVSANNESALGRAQRTWWICVLKQRPGYAPGEGGQSSALDARAPLPSMWALNRDGLAAVLPVPMQLT